MAKNGLSINLGKILHPKKESKIGLKRIKTNQIVCGNAIWSFKGPEVREKGI
jgi:hypothetical protein